MIIDYIRNAARRFLRIEEPEANDGRDLVRSAARAASIMADLATAHATAGRALRRMFKGPKQRTVTRRVTNNIKVDVISNQDPNRIAELTAIVIKHFEQRRKEEIAAEVEKQIG